MYPILFLTHSSYKKCAQTLTNYKLFTGGEIKPQCDSSAAL